MADRQTELSILGLSVHCQSQSAISSIFGNRLIPFRGFVYAAALRTATRVEDSLPSLPTFGALRFSNISLISLGLSCASFSHRSQTSKGAGVEKKFVRFLDFITLD